MSTDAFTTAAYAVALHRNGPDAAFREALTGDPITSFLAGAEWARDHLARQEVADAEVLAALNAQGVIVSPKMHPAPSLDYWGERATEAMRAALMAAKEARHG